MAPVFSRAGRRTEVLRGIWLRKLFAKSGSLFGDGYENQFESLALEDLAEEFGPISEGRYERGPFTVSDTEPPADYSWNSMPDEFMAEHLAYIARVGGGT